MSSKVSFLFLFLICSGYHGHSQKSNTPARLNDSTVVTSDGVPLFLKVSGKGDLCIFLHGGPGAWSKSFEEMGGNVLEDKLTICYFDQRGCGRSASSPDNNYSLNRMLEDIEDIRKTLNTEKVFIMGHSFGGILASAYAQKYPEHVKGLILLNATLDINDSLLNQIDFMGKTLGENITVKNNETALDTFIASKKRIKKAGKDYMILSDSKQNVEKLDSIDSSFKRNYSFGQQALSMPVYLSNFTKQTSLIKVPVLIITGSQDHSIGPDHYRMFQFPNREVKIIKGGHILYYEKNKEFKNAVQAFVQKTASK